MKKTVFGFERPEDSPGFLLWQTTVAWQRLIKKELDHYDISHAQFVIMALLMWFHENKKDASQIQIARASKLDKMTVSKSLKKLVALGLVTRTESVEDTRAKIVFLTAKGKALISELVPVVEKVDHGFFSSLTKAELKGLISVLHKLAEGFSDE